MKQLFYFIFFVSFTNLSFSQHYGAIGTQWTYNGHDSGFNFKAGYRVVKSVNDIMIAGKLAHTITWSDYFQNQPPLTAGRTNYVYQSGDTVFQYSIQTGQYEVKLIFNASVGDTLSLFYSDGYRSVDYYVDSIFNIQVDGITLKQYRLKPSVGPSFTINLVDRIGFLNFLDLNQYLTPGGPQYGNLRCYSDSLIDTNFNNFPCDFISYTSINENNLTFKIKVYPNPAQNTIKIESGDLDILTVQLIDVQGKEQLLDKNSLNYLNISALKKGIYFLKIYTKNEVFIKKWIKD